MKRMLCSMLVVVACTLQAMEGNKPAPTCQHQYSPEIEAYVCTQLQYLQRDNADQFNKIQDACSSLNVQAFMHICQMKCWQRLAAKNSDYFRGKLDN